MKYLHFILSVIAFCLLIITFNILGFIPSAQANTISQHFATVPVNSDGFINVKFEKDQVLDVNIVKVAGHDADYPFHVSTYQ